jgi:hypothetical protein
MYVEKCGTCTVEWYIMSVVMWWGLLEWGILSMAVKALKLAICTHLEKISYREPCRVTAGYRDDQLH